MNHLEYYRYYEVIDDDECICVECDSPCDGDITQENDDGNDDYICEECFEKDASLYQPVVEQPQNPQPEA